MLAWTDQPAISLQPHPEFAPDYARALIESRAEERLLRLQQARDAALRKPRSSPTTGSAWRGWIRSFLAERRLRATSPSGGMELRIDSTLPPVFRPNMVPRS